MIEEVIVFTDKGAPTANGRIPLSGEQQWTLKFPLDDGRELRVRIGRISRDAFREMFLNELIDDLTEKGGEKHE